jgi:hypothetical protein
MTVSTPTEAHQDGTLSVISDLGVQLVRVRCKEQFTMEELGRAIRTSIRCGASIDSISEASGLDPESVKDFARSSNSDENLAVLTGIG